MSIPLSTDLKSVIAKAKEIAGIFSSTPDKDVAYSAHLFCAIHRLKTPNFGMILANQISDADMQRGLVALYDQVPTNITIGRAVPHLSDDAQFALSQAESIAAQFGAKEVTCDHLAVALLCPNHTRGFDQSARLLKAMGLSPETIQQVHDLAHAIIAQSAGFTQSSDGSLVPVNGRGGMQGQKGQNGMESFLTDVTKKAREKKLFPVVGREAEINRTIEILKRMTKNSPVLVGEPGVGKTAIVEGLAQRIVDGDVPEFLKDFEIWSLSVGDLTAGTRFRGDFEERLKQVLDEFSKEDVKKILFVDELHTIIGAGAVGSGSLDAANMLKPALARGTVKFIGATTRKEYRAHVEKDEAFARRCIKVEVGEPSTEATLDIVKRWCETLGQRHKVEYPPEVQRAAVTLTSRYLPSRYQPDKSIDLLDEAGARLYIANQLAKSDSDRRKAVDLDTLRAIVTQWGKVDVRKHEGAAAAALKCIEADLGNAVIGQAAAKRKLAGKIRLQRAGLNPPDKPIGSYLFTGPTGVGKTELAKALAAYLGIEFKRFDMSEYMERHSVSRLIGAPPGYVGYDEGGQLTEYVDEHPYVVLLFDEIEKAHPDIFNILLQILDYGKLTDDHGKTVDFRNVILIMTTNAGEAEAAKRGIGFGAKDDPEGNRAEALSKLFAPEFRNRLDGIITFHKLLREHMLPILDKKTLKQVQALLDDRDITLILDDAAKNFLCDEGFSDEFGGRELERTVNDLLREPLADAIIDRRAANLPEEHHNVTVGLVAATADEPAHLSFVWTKKPAAPSPIGGGRSSGDSPDCPSGGPCGGVQHKEHHVAPKAA